MADQRHWHRWITAAGLLLGVIAQNRLDSMPAKVTVDNPSWAYTLWESTTTVGFWLLVLAMLVWLASIWFRKTRGPRYVALLAISAVAFMVADWGSQIYAQIAVGGAQLDNALADAVGYIKQPVPVVLLIAPYLALAWVVAPLIKQDRFVGAALFTSALVVMMYLYYLGHIDAETLSNSRRWTGATLAIASLPVKGAIVIGVCMLIAHRVPRRHDT